MQAESSRPELRLQGTAAAPGVGRGPAYLLLQGMAIVVCQKVPDVEAELRRFDLALEATRQAIAKLRQEVAQSLGESEAAIFDAHLLVLDDVALIDDVSKEVRSTGFNVEFCFQEVVQRYIDIFERMEDDFLRERASDIRDVTSRVMHHLLGTRPAHAAMAARQQVVVARDLTPSETAGLPEDGVLAFVTEGWQFIVPSIVCGFGHALLFPAIVSLGSGTFPKQFRGAGTAIILGFTDFGSLVFAPVLGRIGDRFGFPAMYGVSAAVALAMAVGYSLIAWKHSDEESQAFQ